MEVTRRAVTQSVGLCLNQDFLAIKLNHQYSTLKLRAHAIVGARNRREGRAQVR